MQPVKEAKFLGFRDFISRVIMVVSERKKQVVIEQTLISWYCIFCSECKVENIYSVVNFGGKMWDKCLR